ncbi:hypothetical protein BV25DRAFT_1919803 [Artomyces pyxidatus]|uniref:Uncharacterized protein n=1 Tax=Artomyces pyxidatus TaxID=48021 RepID=A0ACB8SNK2_9AGAM|nr:hypothetical protein BV25DRAFT_1919803 [Artomyces pyxidatus]
MSVAGSGIRSASSFIPLPPLGRLLSAPLPGSPSSAPWQVSHAACLHLLAGIPRPPTPAAAATGRCSRPRSRRSRPRSRRSRPRSRPPLPPSLPPSLPAAAPALAAAAAVLQYAFGFLLSPPPAPLALPAPFPPPFPSAPALLQQASSTLLVRLNASAVDTLRHVQRSNERSAHHPRPVAVAIALERAPRLLFSLVFSPPLLTLPKATDVVAFRPVQRARERSARYPAQAVHRCCFRPAFQHRFSLLPWPFLGFQLLCTVFARVHTSDIASRWHSTAVDAHHLLFARHPDNPFSILPVLKLSRHAFITPPPCH